MSSVPHQHYTFAEYLARERVADYRSEYFQGEIFAMAGGSRRHAMICDNLVARMLEKLRGGPCHPYSSSLRVKVETTGLTTYPDLSIVCGEEKFDDQEKDTLLNPGLIFEVLSPSTERYDRGRKFNNYKQIPALEEYLLISQTDPRVERITRQGDIGWVLAVTLGLDAVIEFPSLGCSLSLAEIYEGVDFAEA
ncbi:MAG: Uma2 family endonuclease [Pirellulaceae bacterium]|nr:Uma2 family endonuclease [Pirellulaceae bacterium]